MENSPTPSHNLIKQLNYNNHLLWWPFYSQHQTNLINNNYLYFENLDKNNNNINNINNIYPEIKIQKSQDKSPTPILHNLNLSVFEKTEKKAEKNEKNGQITTKFFTDYGGYGYKCSCSKTQCNRFYCECFRSKLYCIDCNCKNCQNKPPKNYVSNRHPNLSTTQPKTELVICTCTKSGCNKKYCECYKNGTKCSSSCRCVGCENSENSQNWKKIENLECCSENSIYIFKNKIFEEIIDKDSYLKEKNKNKMLEKKRKRNDTGNNEEN